MALGLFIAGVLMLTAAYLLKRQDKVGMARRELSKKHNVAMEDLEYVGTMEDHSPAGDIVLYLFNVMDKNSAKYKSTVSYRR